MNRIILTTVEVALVLPEGGNKFQVSATYLKMPSIDQIRDTLEHDLIHEAAVKFLHSTTLEIVAGDTDDQGVETVLVYDPVQDQSYHFSITWRAGYPVITPIQR